MEKYRYFLPGTISRGRPAGDFKITPLNTAMFLNCGGSPLGPAGTGKTETVKDLGNKFSEVRHRYQL